MFGQRLKEYLEKRRIRIADITEKTEIAASTMSSIFSGHTKHPGVDIVAKLVDSFDIPAEDLYFLVTDRSPKRTPKANADQSEQLSEYKEMVRFLKDQLDRLTKANEENANTQAKLASFASAIVAHAPNPNASPSTSHDLAPKEDSNPEPKNAPAVAVKPGSG